MWVDAVLYYRRALHSPTCVVKMECVIALPPPEAKPATAA